MGLEEPEQRVRLRVLDRERLERRVHGHVVPEANEFARDARQLGLFEQRGAALGLLDLGGAREQRIEIPVFLDQQGRGLHPDAGNAGDVVRGIAGQRLHVHHLVGADAELLANLVRPDHAPAHGVEHDHAFRDELHQVLVR